MKLALASLFFVVIAVLSVSATSPLDCSSYTCAEADCKEQTCACGTYKDECGCCDICYKCPDEACNTWQQDVCINGHTCVLEDPEDRFEFGAVGHCKPGNATSV
ncbi:uncharacterized protein LOC144139079 [Haemaphysalis longicornis]